MWLKYQFLEDLDFDLWGCKIKISQYIVSKLIWRFHIFWNLLYLKDLVQKLCVHVKMDLWIAKISKFCTDSQILRALFYLKINFSPICYMTSSGKLPYLKKTMSDFKQFCTKIELKERPFRIKQKVNFDLLSLREMVPFDVLSHIFFLLQEYVYNLQTNVHAVLA